MFGRNVHFNIATILSLICFGWLALTNLSKPHTVTYKIYPCNLFTPYLCQRENNTHKKFNLLKITLFKLSCF